MIARVLVGLGGLGTHGAHYTESATQLAVEVARRHEASLTGVTVADVQFLQRLGPVPIGAGAIAADLRKHRVTETRTHIEEAIDYFVDTCKAAGVRHRVLREEREKPFDYLTSQARYHDVTVLGLRGLFEYGVAGEAEHSPSSTLVTLISAGVRPMIASGPEPRAINKVLIAYSGSVESAKTMRRFVPMRLWPDAQIRLLACGDDTARRQRHLLHAANYCEDYGLKVERDYEPIDPREGVLKVAHEWGADLIVMGNSSRTLLARRVLGDTMLETVEKSDLPLFLAQ